MSATNKIMSWILLSLFFLSIVVGPNDIPIAQTSPKKRPPCGTKTA